MKLVLIGYGKMGRAVEELALRRGHTILEKTNDDPATLPASLWKQADAVIEFTQPDSALANVQFLLKQGVAVISGTTGWLEQKPQAEELCRSLNGAFFHSTNFSIGVNLFFRINELAAELMAKHANYDVEITEIHHVEKKDAPSGTAITLADLLIERLQGRKTSWINEASDAPELLQINSDRVPHVPGTHMVYYASNIDSIELKHVAHTREGFAAGAVAAAEWIKGRQGCFGMRDMLGF